MTTTMFYRWVFIAVLVSSCLVFGTIVSQESLVLTLLAVFALSAVAMTFLGLVAVDILEELRKPPPAPPGSSPPPPPLR